MASNESIQNIKYVTIPSSTETKSTPHRLQKTRVIRFLALQQHIKKYITLASSTESKSTLRPLQNYYFRHFLIQQLKDKTYITLPFLTRSKTTLRHNQHSVAFRTHTSSISLHRNCKSEIHTPLFFN